MATINHRKRIAALETTVQQQARQIADLAARLDTKDAEIEKLVTLTGSMLQQDQRQLAAFDRIVAELGELRQQVGGAAPAQQDQPAPRPVLRVVGGAGDGEAST